MWTILTPVIAVVAAILIIFGIIKFCYRKCPPNKAMVITGASGMRIYTGKAKFVIPILQRVDHMPLENIQVDFVSRSEIPTQDAINIKVDAVANMSIDQDPEILKIAASKFLGYSIEQIQETVTPIMEGNIREIISQIPLVDLIKGDKKVLADKITENVSPNLRDMGLKLTTFNIQNFSDQNGVIHNLGIENTEQIKKDASIAAARAKADVAVAQAEADQRANDARIKAETEIAVKKNEFAIKKAELQQAEDIKVAQQEAAKGIEEQKQDKKKKVAEAEAKLARQEKEIELKEREVSITERKLEAEVKKKAEANKFAAQQEADAELYTEQRQAEADRYRREQDAEAQKFEAEQRAAAEKAKAEADRFAKEQEAEAVKAAGLANATATEAEGKAEAAAIQAKAEAEAQGLLKKAEAMKQYGEAAKMQMQLDVIKTYFEQLPKIAEGVAHGYQNVESIKMYGGDSSALTGNIINGATQISDGLSESLGIDLKSLLAGFLGGKMLGNDSVTINVDDKN